jgi:RNA polymerase sigma-70 factor (ECF subfamily)
VQDALVRAFRFRKRYEAGSNMRAWLFKILTNTFYNRHRQQRNVRRLETDAQVGSHYERFISQATSASGDAEGALINKIAADEIRRAIDGLPTDFRLAVLLCDVYDFSYREISEILSCPVGTVMSRLYRGRRQLQHQLYEYAVEQGYIEPSGKQAEEGGAADLDHYRKKRGLK